MRLTVLLESPSTPSCSTMRSTPSRRRSACSEQSTLSSSARTPRLPVSAIVGLLVDESLPGIDAGLAVAGPLLSGSARAPNLHQVSGLYQSPEEEMAPTSSR